MGRRGIYSTLHSNAAFRAFAKHTSAGKRNALSRSLAIKIWKVPDETGRGVTVNKLFLVVKN